MDIKINNTYKFKFKETFKLLDGVYKVIGEQSYYDISLQEIDLYALFYQKASKTKSEWDTDKVTYYKSVFAKLEDVTDIANIVYVPIPINITDPNSVFDIYPMGDISEYSNMMCNIDLGPTDDPEYMTSLILSIAEIVAYSQGISVTPRLLAYNKVWLTDEEYEAIKRRQRKNKARYY